MSFYNFLSVSNKGFNDLNNNIESIKSILEEHLIPSEWDKWNAIVTGISYFFAFVCWGYIIWHRKRIWSFLKDFAPKAWEEIKDSCRDVFYEKCYLTKPVERDRWLFSGSGRGILTFSLVITILVPLFWLLILAIPSFICWISKGGDASVLGIFDTKTSDQSNLLWAILSQYMDPGNLNNSDGIGSPIAFLLAMGGITCLAGLFVSAIVNVVARRTEYWKKGLILYEKNFKKYTIIIGINEQTPSIVKRAFERKSNYVLIQTRKDVERARLELELKLEDELESKVVFYAGERTSAEDIAKLHVENAEEVFILGEEIGYENEKDHDAFNINCLDHISTYLKQYKKEAEENGEKWNKRIRVHVDLEYQSTFTAFKATHIYQKLDRDVEFIPFNVHEIWAKKILIDNFAVIPAGKKGEVKVQHFIPIDSYIEKNTGKRVGITPSSEKRVHLIILGMNQMGTALATQAALLCHFPNFTENHNKRTTISFIDDHAKEEADYFMGRFSTLFELCRHRTIICNGKNLKYYRDDEIELQKKDENYVPFTDKMDSEEYSHLLANGENNESFLDIQWEFIQGNIASDEIKKYIEKISSDSTNTTTIAICFNNSQQAIASAMYLPEKIYKDANQVLVYQQNCFDIVDDVANGDVEWKRYPNLYPFGMIESSYTENQYENHIAKLEHYLYVKQKNIDSNNAEQELDLNIIPQSMPGGKVPDHRLLDKVDALWDQLGIVQKLANIDAIDSIPMKLRSMGLTSTENTNKIRKALENTNLIKTLADAEHMRWLTERLLMGFRCLTSDEQKKLVGIEQNKEREKRILIEQQRAHLDICSNACLKLVDKSMRNNDIHVIQYLPYLLKCAEWISILRLSNPKYKNSQHVIKLKEIFGELKNPNFKFVEKGNESVIKEFRIENHSYWIAKHTVTNEVWDSIIGTRYSKNEKGEIDPTLRYLPIVNVSKNDVDDFLLVLKKKTGLSFSLPSQKEWRYAAQISTPYLKSNTNEWHNKICIATDKRCSVFDFNEVQENDLGIYHMLGNVWEWTRTCDPHHRDSYFLCGGSWRFKTPECTLNRTQKVKSEKHWVYWSGSWNRRVKSDDLGLRLIWRFDEEYLGNKSLEELETSCESEHYISSEDIQKRLIEKWFEKHHMCEVDAGYFIMGTSKNLDVLADDNETPIHVVYISKAFKICQVPVTQSLWNAVFAFSSRENPSSARIGNEIPQTNVSWNKVNEFIERLNKLTGKKYRLPSEAEWEYVAKGGHKSDIANSLKSYFANKNKDIFSSIEEIIKHHQQQKTYYPLYSGGTESIAWFDQPTIQCVGLKSPNELDVYDMSGNVWEWCLDHYQSDIYQDCIDGKEKNVKIQLHPVEDEYKNNGFITDPIGIDRDYSAHVFRGGSWRSEKIDCRSTRANFWNEDHESDDLGFRLVLDGAIDINDFIQK